MHAKLPRGLAAAAEATAAVLYSQSFVGPRRLVSWGRGGLLLLSVASVALFLVGLRAVADGLSFLGRLAAAAPVTA